MTGLKFNDICYAYPKGGFEVANISFELMAGECLALTGENGGGKTTVGKLASGILKPSSGYVTVNGENIASLSLGQIGDRVGYLFQDPSRQLFAPTVLEDLIFPAVINGEERRSAEKSARDILERMGIYHLSERSVFRLSGGEKQRLAIAGLLTRKPAVLVLDEPTTGLDPCNCAILGEVIDGLLSGGTAVLLITHDMDFAERHCQSRICMTGGLIC